MDAIDIEVTLLWVVGLALLVHWFVRPPKRHRWHDIQSTEVATLIRRIRRPR